MASPSLQPQSWDTNLRNAIEKEGGWAGLGLDYTAIMDSFPVGAVWLWADESTIPTNWEIADDAVGRFLLAAATGETPWEQSGSATHVHDDHVVTQPDTHPALETGTPVGDPAAVDSPNNENVASTVHTHLTQQLPHAGTDVDSHSTADHTPPAFKLFVIVKVS